MAKVKTKSGLSFEIDERIKDDVRLYQYLVEMQSEDRMVKSTAFFDFIKFLFGGRQGAIDFQNAVASAHDGVCRVEDMTQEVNEIMESLGLKKS